MSGRVIRISLVLFHFHVFLFHVLLAGRLFTSGQLRPVCTSMSTSGINSFNYFHPWPCVYFFSPLRLCHVLFCVLPATNDQLASDRFCLAASPLLSHRVAHYVKTYSRTQWDDCTLPNSPAPVAVATRRDGALHRDVVQFGARDSSTGSGLRAGSDLRVTSVDRGRLRGREGCVCGEAWGKGGGVVSPHDSCGGSVAHQQRNGF